MLLYLLQLTFIFLLFWGMIMYANVGMGVDKSSSIFIRIS